MPYENYRKVFRTSQKNVERELSAIQSTSTDLTNRARNGKVRKEEVVSSIEGMIGRVENLKRKVRLTYIAWFPFLMGWLVISLPIYMEMQERLRRMSCVNGSTI